MLAPASWHVLCSEALPGASSRRVSLCLPESPVPSIVREPGLCLYNGAIPAYPPAPNPELPQTLRSRGHTRGRVVRNARTDQSFCYDGTETTGLLQRAHLTSLLSSLSCLLHPSCHSASIHLGSSTLQFCELLSLSSPRPPLPDNTRRYISPSRSWSSTNDLRSTFHSTTTLIRYRQLEHSIDIALDSRHSQQPPNNTHQQVSTTPNPPS